MDEYNKRNVAWQWYSNLCRTGLNLMRPLMILILVFSVFHKPNPSFAEEGDETGIVRVESVHILDNKRIEDEAILAVIKTKKGDIFDEDQLDKDLLAIVKMGYFKDVKQESEDGPAGKRVYFRVIEKPIIGIIVFEGNDRVKESDLKEELGLKLFEIQDDNEIRQSVNRLTDFYREKGYYNVKITWRVEPIPNNEVRVRYTIAENEKVFIKHIGFIGNNVFDDKELKDIMITSEKGFLSWFTDAGILNRKKLEADVNNLTVFYSNNGYVDAVVGTPEISYDEEEEGLRITIEIEEGPQYTVNNVAIEGDLIKPAEELLEQVQTARGNVFSREIVRDDIQTLQSSYINVGYAYAEVTPLTRMDDENNLVDITYRIDKRKKVRIERINISGNEKTRDKVIRRELKSIEGEYYSGEALERSEENLDRLGFFEDIELKPRRGSQDDLMILDVNVKETLTGSFQVGAGYSQEYSFFAFFQFAQENFLGRGEKIQASATYGGLASQFDILFIEPYLFDTRISSSISIYKQQQEFDDYTYEGVSYQDYSRDGEGGRISFGFPLQFDDFTRVIIRYTYDNSYISNIPDYASQAYKDMQGENVTSGLALTLQRDSRNRAWNPNKGSLNRLRLEYTGGILGGDVYYDGYSAESAWYFPLFWKTVFLIQGNWGYLKKRSGGKLPVYIKYRLGGLNSIRGFDYGDISPHDPDTGYKIGGEKMMYYTLEYRFPVLSKQGFLGLVFLDTGNVWTKDDNFDFGHMRTSVGAGIRWRSPMGPLRLEYGYNLDPRDDEEQGQLEFSVGGLF